jgi:hypothetical protein
MCQPSWAADGSDVTLTPAEELAYQWLAGRFNALWAADTEVAPFSY